MNSGFSAGTVATTDDIIIFSCAFLICRHLGSPWFLLQMLLTTRSITRFHTWICSDGDHIVPCLLCSHPETGFPTTSFFDGGQFIFLSGLALINLAPNICLLRWLWPARSAFKDRSLCPKAILSNSYHPKASKLIAYAKTVERPNFKAWIIYPDVISIFVEANTQY